MDSTINKLQEKIEATKANILNLEIQINTEKSQLKDTETALRVVSQLVGKSIPDMDFADLPSNDGINFTDVILEAITVSGKDGITPSEIKEYIKSKHGNDIKDSTLSVIVQRHKVKERVARVGKKWFLTSFASSQAETEGTPVRETPENFNNLI